MNIIQQINALSDVAAGLAADGCTLMDARASRHTANNQS